MVIAVGLPGEEPKVDETPPGVIFVTVGPPKFPV